MAVALGHSPTSPSSIFRIPWLCPISSCFPCLCFQGLCSLPDSFSGSLLPLTPSPPSHTVGRRGCVAAFYFWSPWGGGAALGLFWHPLCPESRGVMSVFLSVPPPTPLSHPLLPSITLSAFVSFLSFRLSSLGALCSCCLFVSASPLNAPSAPSPPSSSSEKLSTSRASIFQVCGARWRWSGGLPACPARTIIIPSRVVIHIYKIERMEPRMRECGG